MPQITSGKHENHEQESIPVGCVLPTSVATIRSQYQGEDRYIHGNVSGIPNPLSISIPWVYLLPATPIPRYTYSPGIPIPLGVANPHTYTSDNYPLDKYTSQIPTQRYTCPWVYLALDAYPLGIVTPGYLPPWVYLPPGYT